MDQDGLQHGINAASTCERPPVVGILSKESKQTKARFHLHPRKQRNASCQNQTGAG